MLWSEDEDSYLKDAVFRLNQKEIALIMGKKHSQVMTRVKYLRSLGLIPRGRIDIIERPHDIFPDRLVWYHKIDGRDQGWGIWRDDGNNS